MKYDAKVTSDDNRYSVPTFTFTHTPLVVKYQLYVKIIQDGYTFFFFVKS